MAQQIQHMPGQAPDSSKPYCLMNSDGSVADWYATHADAMAAMRDTSKARYSYSEMQYNLTPMRYSYGEGDAVWIEALQARTYNTPKYSDPVVVTTEKLNNFVKNFHDNVRGIEITTDYEHGMDAAKGGKASGTIKDMKVDGDKLMYQVEFTDTAKQEIKNGEWKYFSADWLDTYVHEDGSTHSDVVLGGGLTNRPVAKGLSTLPVNFSEFFTEVQMVDPSGDFEPGQVEYMFSTLTYAQKKALPDSKFLYIAPDGKRHLPVPDETHVRAAISRLSQKATGTVNGDSWLTDSLRSSLLAKARAMLNRKQGGEMTDEMKALLKSLGIQFTETSDEATLLSEARTKVEALNAEVEPIRKLKEDAEGNKSFAEQFPEQFAQMQEDREFRRNFQSKQFAETIGSKRFSDTITQKVGDTEETVSVETTKGLSAKCLNEIQEVHRKFSEGTVTATDFENVMNSVLENGIVDYGESGTTSSGGTPPEITRPSGNVKEVRSQFSEYVNKLQAKEENKDKQFMEVVAIAAKENPELYRAYMEVR